MTSNDRQDETSQYRPVALPDYREYPLAEMRARALDFLAEVRCRHTVRDFSARPVPRDIIETCITAAGTAPNGANLQPWHFAVIGNAELKKRIRDAAEAEEKEFYAGRAGEEWLDALKPLGTDPSKPFLETAPWLIAFSASARAGAPAAFCARTITCRNQSASPPGF